MATTSQFLHVATTAEPCSRWPLASPAKEYSWELDNFQKYACAAIDAGENVLVTAKTGSGKTLVGEYQIAHSLRKGRRVFYTTPIKSLSNQKFHDLKAMFPSVGIMTGDIKFQPDAQVVIMTTEILRNMLYKKGTQTEHLGLSGQISLDGLDAVIFDECHYINNKERGKVWEETMILLPREVNLVLLSATIAEPQWFASWLGDLKQKPIWLIPTSHRVVPLTHYVMMADGEMRAVMDATEVFHAGVYKDWLQEKQRLDKQKKAFARAVAERKEETKQSRATAYRPDELAVVKEELANRGGLEGKVEDHSYVSVMNRTIRRLREKELLPALFFCFSRRGCEQYAGQVEEELLSGEESADARNSFLYQLRAHQATLEKVPQFHQVLGLVVRGVAFHHSGLLPVLKEAIEILFSKGFIKVLFCTETFAVGINMPTKTAVFTGLKKYDDKTQGQRVLTTDEYIQMAGRAGRRGLDKLGTVLYLPDREPVTGEELKTMMKSGMPSITSRMEFGYEFILKTTHSESANRENSSESVQWLDLIKSSYWYRQAEAQMAGLMADWKKAMAESQVIYNSIGEAYVADVMDRDQIEIAMRGLFKGNKDYQRRLDQWKNKHMGPRWEEAWKKLQAMNKVNITVSALENDIDALKAVLEGAVLVEKSQDFLRKADFIGTDGKLIATSETGNAQCSVPMALKLTRRGLLATEINEGHPILTTELYLSGLLEKMSGKEIMMVMGAFVCEGKDEEQAGFYSLRDLTISDGVYEAMVFLEEKTNILTSLERSTGIVGCDDYWKLGLMWIEIAGRWLSLKADRLEDSHAGGLAGAICQAYGIYEGNFTRGIMKLANLHEELMALATLDANVALMDKLVPLQGRIVRGLVIPDSLYLRV